MLLAVIMIKRQSSWEKNDVRRKSDGHEVWQECDEHGGRTLIKAIDAEGRWRRVCSARLYKIVICNKYKGKSMAPSSRTHRYSIRLGGFRRGVQQYMSTIQSTHWLDRQILSFQLRTWAWRLGDICHQAQLGAEDVFLAVQGTNLTQER